MELCRTIITLNPDRAGKADSRRKSNSKLEADTQNCVHINHALSVKDKLSRWWMDLIRKKKKRPSLLV